MNKLKQIPEFLRFVMVGLFATGLHYGIYFVLQKFIQVNVAYTLGYVLSFVANFYLTAYFTFGKPPSWKKAFGFSFCGWVFPVRWLPSQCFSLPFR